MVSNENTRAMALKRLKTKREFKMHIGAYAVINAMLIVVWAMSGHGHFWPGWVLAFWGVGLAFNGWSAYFQRPFSEEEIRREMEGKR